MPELPCNSYHVKLQVRVSEEVRCFYEKFGRCIFNLKKVQEKCPIPCNTIKSCECDSDSTSSEPTTTALPTTTEAESCSSDTVQCELKSYIMAVEFDKCDCTKATFTLFVTFGNKELLCSDAPCCVSNESHCDKIFSDKYSICVGIHDYFHLVSTFVINSLPHGILSTGVVNDAYRYEIFRLNKKEDCCESANPECFNIIFPMTENLKNMAFDLKLGGTAVKQIINTEVKIKVRVIGTSARNCSASFPALMVFNKTNCTACLEVCFDDVKCLKKGYEYAFKHDNKCECRCKKEQCAVKHLDDMSLEEIICIFKRFDVVGLSKCTEKTLLSFQICHGPRHIECCEEALSDPSCCTDDSESSDNLCLCPTFKVVSNVSAFSYQFVC